MKSFYINLLHCLIPSIVAAVVVAALAVVAAKINHEVDNGKLAWIFEEQERIALEENIFNKALDFVKEKGRAAKEAMKSFLEVLKVMLSDTEASACFRKLPTDLLTKRSSS